MPARQRITDEQCFQAALNFSSRAGFASKSRPEYDALWRRGLLDKACAHMAISPVYSSVRWTREAAFSEAAKYQNRAEFKRECSGAYCFALENGILDHACLHMRGGQNFWHVFELMAVSLKFTSRAEFKRAHPGAYGFARDHGMLEIIFAHMDRRRAWCRHSVLAEASRHQSRGAFHALATGAYQHAIQGGYLDEACAHMLPPEYGFSKEKPATLYHLRITTADGVELFKLGITNRAPAARIAGMGVPAGAVVDVLDAIVFDNGRDARITEKRLHRKFSSFRYVGPLLMKNGNTELFTVKLLD